MYIYNKNSAEFPRIPRQNWNMRKIWMMVSLGSMMFMWVMLGLEYQMNELYSKNINGVCRKIYCSGAERMDEMSNSFLSSSTFSSSSLYLLLVFQVRDSLCCPVWNLLCRPVWPHTHRDPPNSTSQVLGSRLCTTTNWRNVKLISILGPEMTL